MTDSVIKTYCYENGEIQRVQLVTADSFDEIDFLFPQESPGAFQKIVSLYCNFIVPKCPWVFGRMVLYYVPEDMKQNLQMRSKSEGLSDEAGLADFLRKNVRVSRAGLVYRNASAREICTELMERGCMEIIRGRLPGTRILPIGNSLGFLSESMPEARVKVNSSFFIMDCFDVASAVDRIGTPIGLMVKNGCVINPPAYNREAFLVNDEGKVEIRSLRLEELSFEIGGAVYVPAQNAAVYERPACCRIPGRERGLFAAIAGCRVEAVYCHGGFEVPSSGFVLKLPEAAGVNVGDTVVYKGLEHVKFGIQTGNSIIVNGVKTSGFISGFYNIFTHLGRKAYPPSLYPLDYEKARAPRIGLGATAEGRPCIFWAEGPKKTGYESGVQSCGASLGEMASIAEDLGIYNAVNLDGGGSAQILIDNRRELTVSDRNPEDDSDAERAVPAGLYMMN